MNKYRNVKTGVTVLIEGHAFGDWVPVQESAPEAIPEKKPEQPKTEPKKRKTKVKK